MNAKEIAARFTILRGVVGSTTHGVALPGTDDRDEMGVCLEPPEYVIGLRLFEQHTYRTAEEREPRKHGNAPRSQAGDLDLVVYSLRKWARLAAQGNPTVLLLLFLPPSAIVLTTEAGRALQRSASLFLSREVGARYLGYLTAQRQRLMGERGQRNVTRPELVERFGFDTKYAACMLRLGVQGVELLETGKLTLPVPEPMRSHLMDVRQGRVPLQEILTETGELEARLRDLREVSPLPKEPDWRGINQLLGDLYLEAWGGRVRLRWQERPPCQPTATAGPGTSEPF